jgi:hypothetical protein
MATKNWLERYYGKDFDLLNPTVFIDGKKKAVVRLTKTGERGYSGVGFVLIDKNGNHTASSHKSLHEGLPTDTDLERMRQELKKEDP